MFREALDYPTRPPRGGRAVLVGGTLLALVGALGGVATLDATLAPLLLVALPPWLLVRGYYVRVVRTTVGHEFPTPPSFGGIGGLLRDGLAAVLISGGYLLPGVAVLAPLAYARSRGTTVVDLVLGDAVSSAVADALLAGVGVIAMFAVLSLIGALYALPVAVARYAYTGRVGAAFDLRSVAPGAATEDYVVTWVVSMLLQVLLLPVAYLLKPILAGFYVHFLVAVGVRYCYGQGVGAAMALDPLVAPTRESGASTDREPVRSAVRPIEDSDRPELVDGEPDRGADDPFVYPARERSEGERT